MRGQGARVESREWKRKSWGQASALARAFLKERKSVTVLRITLPRSKAGQEGGASHGHGLVFVLRYKQSVQG